MLTWLLINMKNDDSPESRKTHTNCRVGSQSARLQNPRAIYKEECTSNVILFGAEVPLLLNNIADFGIRVWINLDLPPRMLASGGFFYSMALKGRC